MSSSTSPAVPAVSRPTVASEQDHADARAKRLLANNSADVLQYLNRRTRRPEDSADLLAESMLIVWKKRASIPTDDVEARMWYFGIARRILLSYYRGRSRSEQLANALKAQIASSELATDRDEALVDAKHELRALISNLPVGDREVLTLVHWDGFSLAEVAIVMGVSSSTVRSRYRRARAKLRRDLETR